MTSRVQCLSVVLLLAANVAAAATISVRKDGTGDYTVLQEALNAAADGDSILVGPGEYTEMSWVRLPGWSWDVQACGYVTAQNLTIIGSGREQTVIGPRSYAGVNGQYSPLALVYTGGSSLSLQELAVCNCYHGVYAIGGLMVDSCLIDNNRFGIFRPASGSGGWVRDSIIRTSLPLSPIGLKVESSGGGAGFAMERCRSEGVYTIIAGVDGMTIVDSEFTDEIVGIAIYDNARVYIHNSVVSNMSKYGIKFTLGSGGYCEISDSDISGEYAALDSGGNAPDGRFVVYGSSLSGGTEAVVFARYRPMSWLVAGCDLIKGSGPVVQCGPSYVTVTHDMRNNYWGTTNEADIQAWIIDHNDDPNIPATVLYSPFDGQPVPTESTSWGDLKALWR